MKKRILVAPLNWGLGHATRCIPIINALITHGFEPIIASDGEALMLLQKEFPNLLRFTLPSYNVTYPKKSKYFKYDLSARTICKCVSQSCPRGIFRRSRFYFQQRKNQLFYPIYEGIKHCVSFRTLGGWRGFHRG